MNTIMCNPRKSEDEQCGYALAVTHIIIIHIAFIWMASRIASHYSSSQKRMTKNDCIVDLLKRVALTRPNNLSGLQNVKNEKKPIIVECIDKSICLFHQYVFNWVSQCTPNTVATAHTMFRILPQQRYGKLCQKRNSRKKTRTQSRDVVLNEHCRYKSSSIALKI